MRVLRPVLAVGFLAVMAGPVLAQDRYAAVDVRGGYTYNSGDAGTFLKGQSSFGVGVKVALGTRMHVGLSADWAHHSQKDASGNVLGGPNDPQWNVLHSFLKLSFDAVNTGKVTVALNAGPGLMFFSPNQVLKDGTGVKNDAHMAFNVGGTLTYWFSDRIGLLISPQLDFALKKTSGQIFTTGSAMMLPLTAGFQFKI